MFRGILQESVNRAEVLIIGEHRIDLAYFDGETGVRITIKAAHSESEEFRRALGRGARNWCSGTMEHLPQCTCRAYASGSDLVIEALGSNKPALVQRVAYLASELQVEVEHLEARTVALAR